MRRALPRGGGLPIEDWTRRHRALLAIVWLHALAVPAFGIARGYGVGHSLLEGGLIALPAAIGTWAPLSRPLRAGAVSLGLLTASALLVHFSGGYIEFHFHFFVMIALLSLYQHWLPFLVAVAYVALHHGIAGVFDPGTVYNHPSAVEHPWRWAGIHAGFVLAAGAANVFTWQLSEQEQKRRRDLQRVTESVLAQLPLPKLLDEVLLRVREVLEADTATVSLYDDDGGPLTVRATAGEGNPPEGAEARLGGGLTARIATSGRPVASAAVDPAELDNPVHRAAGVRSFVGVPLLVEGAVIGVLDVGSRAQRRFSEAELEVLQLVADRIGPSIDRARLHDRERRIAETLQRSLLAKRLPSPPGMDLGFRYRPAGEGVAVGGDWYDAFVLPRNRLGVVIGDVAGHGTEAASLMGQLRTGLRAYAMEGHGPAEAVARLDELTVGLGELHMATLLYLELDPDTGALDYVSAGHLPPAAVSANGEVRWLDAGRGLPLGSGFSPGYVASRATLAPGSTLVLYTDGLVESRSTGVDDGLARLDTVLSESAGEELDTLCDVIMDSVPSADALADDTAILVVRLATALDDVLELELPAEPASAAQLRRTLERWLEEHGVGTSDAYAMVVAANEAAANTIEHAYGPGAASFRLSAERLNGEVCVSVADDGQWREPRGLNRGRGLDLMEKLVDRLDVDRRESGTTVRMRKRV